MYEVSVIKDETTPEGIRVIYAGTCREVCSQQVAVAVKDGVILEAAFAGGAPATPRGYASLSPG